MNKKQTLLLTCLALVLLAAAMYRLTMPGALFLLRFTDEEKALKPAFIVRDAGIHTLGEIWRRNQIGVPSRDEISDYLAGKLSKEHAEYVDFRIDILKCRYTIALKNDIESQTQSELASQTTSRRKKYFDSSAGLLRKKKD